MANSEYKPRFTGEVGQFGGAGVEQVAPRDHLAGPLHKACPAQARTVLDDGHQTPAIGQLIIDRGGLNRSMASLKVRKAKLKKNARVLKRH